MTIRNRLAVRTLPLVLASFAVPALADGAGDRVVDGGGTGAGGGTVATPAATLAGAAVSVNEFDVFVDLPTGFAFVKTPTGWTFVRKIDANQLKSLPPSTLTALAVDQRDGSQVGTRYALSDTAPARL